MVIIHRGRTGRKPTGGSYKLARDKRKFESGNRAALTGIGKPQRIFERIKGGGVKARLLRTSVVNLFAPKTKQFFKATVKLVKENAANRHYVRRNIMTRGAVIETDKGKARITSRPGQDGAVNAVLIQ